MHWFEAVQKSSDAQISIAWRHLTGGCIVPSWDLTLTGKCATESVVANLCSYMFVGQDEVLPRLMQSNHLQTGLLSLESQAFGSFWNIYLQVMIRTTYKLVMKE